MGDGIARVGGELVRLEVDTEGIAQVHMEDPLGRNALSPAFQEQLLDCLERLRADSSVRVVVLLGLPDVFCSGADQDTVLRLAAGDFAPADIMLPRAVLEMPVPVIAAMEGHAIGGGLALGVCADLVLIARESRYGCSFMNMGFTPGMGSTRLLEHVLTPAVAHELLYTGQPLKGAHFEGRGGFNYVLPRAEVRGKALELAGRIAEKPRGSLEMLKRVLSMPRRQAFEAGRTVETLMHEISFRQADLPRLIEEHYD